MKEPRFFINPPPDMAKQAKVGRTEAVLFSMTMKPEALVLQVTHRIFSKMTNAFGLTMNETHREWGLSAPDQPACNVLSGVHQLTRVCTENLNPDVIVMESAEQGV